MRKHAASSRDKRRAAREFPRACVRRSWERDKAETREHLARPRRPQVIVERVNLAPAATLDNPERVQDPWPFLSRNRVDDFHAILLY